jgi:hypothetical protein
MLSRGQIGSDSVLVVSISPMDIRPCFVLRQMSGQPHQRIGTAARSVDQSLKSARHLEDPKLIQSETKIIVGTSGARLTKDYDGLLQ